MTMQVKTQPEGGGFTVARYPKLRLATLLTRYADTGGAHQHSPRGTPLPRTRKRGPANQPAVDTDTAVVHPPAEMVNGRIT